MKNQKIQSFIGLSELCVGVATSNKNTTTVNHVVGFINMNSKQRVAVGSGNAQMSAAAAASDSAALLLQLMLML